MGGNKALEKAASILSSGRLKKTKLVELSKGIRPLSENQSYNIQNIVKDNLTKSGFGAQVGSKIGCTTPVMQKYLNIHNPCSGVIFSSTVHQNFGKTEHNNYQHPGVECEIAISLGKDMTEKNGPYDEDSVIDHVESVMAAIEIVDDRWDDYPIITTPTLIADNFFGAGCTLGSKHKISELDINTIKGFMKINNTTVGSGIGKDIMGNPLKALAWLANLKLNSNSPLKSGHFVLLGSIVETKWVNKGDLVEIEIEKLGKASIEFI